jgi:hypothetical protein
VYIKFWWGTLGKSRAGREELAQDLVISFGIRRAESHLDH